MAVAAGHAHRAVDIGVGAHQIACPGGGIARGVGLQGREHVLVVAEVGDEADAELLKLVNADDGPCLGARLGERREQHRRQNGDDGDDDKQLDEREGRAGRGDAEFHGGGDLCFLGVCDALWGEGQGRDGVSPASQACGAGLWRLMRGMAVRALGMGGGCG